MSPASCGVVSGVMKSGRIVERGTHDELMDNKSVYFELYEKQLLEEEENA